MPARMPAAKDLAKIYIKRIEKTAIDLRKPVAVNWKDVFTRFPRYCHVLLIAPHHTSPDYTDYSIQGADDFFAFAGSIATVKYLRDAQATRANVEKELKEFNPRLVVHYDHGGTNAIYGESVANNPQAVIDTANSDKLRMRVASTVSCLSASGLGPDAVGKGCTSYVGYNDLHWIVTSTHMAFWNCASKVHQKLVLGYNTKNGFDSAIATYNTNIAYYSSIGDTFTAVHLQMDRDRLTLVGSQTATTCPKRFEILWPLHEMVVMKKIPDLVWPPKLLDIDQERYL
ncbi:MAG: hypothetical protein WCS74_04370 [Dehalococcoidales bacterium]|jgi:hypothetical protein|nr:hypothetical protein [Dehalococcoidales bacterium]MDD4322618.1 hypothetical protein [Dehalococcoidales bacterium]MDD4794512.1 hypothetical protein [Dehalococcoidales bacterium]MDD5498867.1 hypothetical protein [Dehalococcoidales bacterium]MDX9803403.1 hypothetical protein [Dehalococcoidales bacterium]